MISHPDGQVAEVARLRGEGWGDQNSCKFRYGGVGARSLAGQPSSLYLSPYGYKKCQRCTTVFRAVGSTSLRQLPYPCKKLETFGRRI